MKRASRIAVASLVLAIASTGASADDGYHWRAPGMQVILHHSDRSMQLQSGDNPLDRLNTIVCPTSVCLVSFRARAYVGASGFYICGLLDGVPASPPCADDSSSGWGSLLQSAKVLRGEHTLQTILHFPDGAAAVQGWEVEYTVYEKPD
jgi:hypothetical protein